MPSRIKFIGTTLPRICRFIRYNTTSFKKPLRDCWVVSCLSWLRTLIVRQIPKGISFLYLGNFRECERTY